MTATCKMLNRWQLTTFWYSAPWFFLSSLIQTMCTQHTGSRSIQSSSSFSLNYFRIFQWPEAKGSAKPSYCLPFSSAHGSWSNSISTTSLLVLQTSIMVKAMEKGPSISNAFHGESFLSLCATYYQERVCRDSSTGMVSPPSVAVLVLLQAPGRQLSLVSDKVHQSLQWPELPTAHSHKQNDSKRNCKAWCCYVCISLSQLAEMPLLLDPIIGRLHFSIISPRTEHISSTERKRVVTHPSTCLIFSRIVLLMKNWEGLGYTHGRS